MERMAKPRLAVKPAACIRCGLMCQSRQALVYHLLAIHGINYGNAQAEAGRIFGPSVQRCDQPAVQPGGADRPTIQEDRVAEKPLGESVVSAPPLAPQGSAIEGSSEVPELSADAVDLAAVRPGRESTRTQEGPVCHCEASNGTRGLAPRVEAVGGSAAGNLVMPADSEKRQLAEAEHIASNSFDLSPLIY